MLPLILFGAAYLIGRTTKETNEFADGGMMDDGTLSESEYKDKLQKLKSDKKITLSIGNHGLIFMQKIGGGNYFMKSYRTYKEAYQAYSNMQDGGMMAKGGEIEEGDVVIVKSENLKAEVTNVGTDFITVEFIGKRPEGGDKRGMYKKSDLNKNKK